MLFHISAFSIIIALVFGESKLVHWRSIEVSVCADLQLILISSRMAVIVYKRARIIPFLAPYLPSRMSTYISGYQPLQSYSFADQAAAGMSSSSFDVESQNMASGSGEGRVGLDSEGVEEVRRIMSVFSSRLFSYLYFMVAIQRMLLGVR